MIGGMTEYVAVPSENLYPIPCSMDPLEAALCEPFAVALHALHVSSFRIMDTAAVLGPGPIGLMVTRALRNAGASLIVTTGTKDDITPRLELASKTADATVNIHKENPVKVVKDLTKGLGVDVVFDTTGSAQAAPQGIQMLKTRGKLIVIGHYSGSMALLDPSYKGYSLTGNVSYDWDTWERLIPYLTRRSVDFSQYISHRLPLGEAEKGFELARSRKSLKVLFQPTLG